MTAEEFVKDLIRPETIKAADIIVNLLTPEERELLDINLNGRKIPLIQQLCSR